MSFTRDQCNNMTKGNKIKLCNDRQIERQMERFFFTNF